MQSPLNIIFAGTPHFAAQHLDALISSKHRVVAVYTKPDSPAGRGKKLQASAVKQLAEQHQLPIYQPATLKSQESQQQLAAIEADIMVVVAYGLILPKAVLDTPPLGCINVHGSLLPRWRGAAPIQRAIWAGDQQTGVTIMQMDEGLDTGPSLYKASLTLAVDETSATLYDRLAEQGPSALLTALDKMTKGQLIAEDQDNAQANYAEKLSKREAHINWHQPAAQLERNVRAFNPWPVAYFKIADSNIKIWRASVCPLAHSAPPGTIITADKSGIVIATGEQGLRLEMLQFPGKKAMTVADILNSRKDVFQVGALLASAQPLADELT